MNTAYKRFDAMKILTFPGKLLVGLGLLLLPALCFGAEPVPLVHVHAHNDYEHKRPLFDALDHGFCSVEADIYRVAGQGLLAPQRPPKKTDDTVLAHHLAR